MAKSTAPLDKYQVSPYLRRQERLSFALHTNVYLIETIFGTMYITVRELADRQLRATVGEGVRRTACGSAEGKLVDQRRKAGG